ncbi:hypothetical protein RHSIM_Rhsim11G0085400 [Rhododendron simsii]|uniref:Uncharacterized protein n=1 Tax=Rhododendron simsii TaxID=118357 RepID=A0A834G7M6_RHOSS|nr:hypothetical protein RHSIM_Rhsim11G0085400 [Rhododendron simsii]
MQEKALQQLLPIPCLQLPFLLPEIRLEMGINGVTLGCLQFFFTSLPANMVYVTSWDDFVEKSVQLFRTIRILGADGSCKAKLTLFQDIDQLRDILVAAISFPFHQGSGVTKAQEKTLLKMTFVPYDLVCSIGLLETLDARNMDEHYNESCLTGEYVRNGDCKYRQDCRDITPWMYALYVLYLIGIVCLEQKLQNPHPIARERRRRGRLHQQAKHRRNSAHHRVVDAQEACPRRGGGGDRRRELDRAAPDLVQAFRVRGSTGTRTAAIPFSSLFASVDRLDWVLMVVGSLSATAHGTALVVYLHYFAKIIHLLVHDHPHTRGDFYDDLVDGWKEHLIGWGPESGALTFGGNFRL